MANKKFPTHRETLATLPPWTADPLARLVHTLAVRDTERDEHFAVYATSCSHPEPGDPQTTGLTYGDLRALSVELHMAPYQAWEQGYQAALDDIKRAADGTPGNEYTTNPHTFDGAEPAADVVPTETPRPAGTHWVTHRYQNGTNKTRVCACARGTDHTEDVVL